MKYAITGRLAGRSLIVRRRLKASAAVVALSLIEAGGTDVLIEEAGQAMTLEAFRLKHWGIRPPAERRDPAGG